MQQQQQQQQQRGSEGHNRHNQSRPRSADKTAADGEYGCHVPIGYHTYPMTPLDDEYQYEDDSDEDDNSGWHVAIVPNQLPSDHSATSQRQQAPLATFVSLLSVAFSAIKQNIVSRPLTLRYTALRCIPCRTAVC